jgi:ketosteroid isomerase-like protein
MSIESPAYSAELEDRVARLEALVSELRDERAILSTMYTYSHCIDYGSETEFADCWLEDAVWEASSRGRIKRHSEGINEILAFFRQHSHAPEHYHKHPMLEPRITVDGDHAEAISYFLRVDEHPDGPYIYAFGRYRDVLTRCNDGRWRFKYRQNMGEQLFDKNSSQ